MTCEKLGPDLSSPLKMKWGIHIKKMVRLKLLNILTFQRIDIFHFLKFHGFKNFMAPFYGWGSTASRLEPLRGGSLLFTTKFPEIPGTNFIDLGRMKD